ncbi:MAG: hypothetical protein JW730_18375 [Anaerolineales bacterium]|nr:hypothetical protein [Anaerolineales bacterium]
MQRYKLLFLNNSSSAALPSPNGDWVRYEDAQTCISECREELAEVYIDFEKIMDERDALKAELAKYQYSKGSGPIPTPGSYWVRMPSGWAVQYTSVMWQNPDNMKWEGPIPEPEEE